MGQLLEVNNLSLSLKQDKETLRILDNITFSVESGRVLGIVGESGCGKTMLSNGIIGLFPKNLAGIEGEIKYKDYKIDPKKPKTIRKLRGKEIAMVFQNPNTSLNPVLTIGKQMVDIIREHKKISKKAAFNTALKWLEEVMLPDPQRVISSYPHELSGGMKQRVVIAMALSCEAKLILADEPTTALDVTTQFEILKLLQKLKNEHNISIIIVTHDIGVASFLCDEIMVMYAGQVVEIGNTKDLLEQPIHPYTYSLLKSLPGSGKKVEELFTIPGNVPRPAEFNPGCRFYTRCPNRTDECLNNKPLRTKDSNYDKEFACFNPLVHPQEALKG